MKPVAAIVAALLATVDATNADEVVIKPKTSDSAVVLTISRGEGSAVGAAGEIVIKPKTSDSAVVLTIREGKVVKASVRAKPEHMADSEPVTAASAGTP